MWIVCNIKDTNPKFFLTNLKKISEFNKLEFYSPKILCNKAFKGKILKEKKYILGKYIFCKSSLFQDINFIKRIEFTKGLKSILKGFVYSQKEIIKFINFCKKYEDVDGCLEHAFFQNLGKKNLKFINGPFKNFIVEKLALENNKTRFNIGNFSISCSNRSKYAIVSD